MTLFDQVLPKTYSIIQECMDSGLQTGVQYYVSLDRQVIVDGGTGYSNIDIPMKPDTIMLWLSSTKPITAVAIGQLWEKGLLHLDAPVSHFIPNFGTMGKEMITIRHLLTHMGGIRSLNIGVPQDSWGETIRKICAMRLEPHWKPGKKAGYHLASSWFILGELIRVIDGRPCDQYVREEIFEPLGMMDSWIGIPSTAYKSYEERIGCMYNTEKGSSVLLDWHNEEQCAWVNPGGNGRGPIRELGRFYEMLLNRGTLDGKTILSPVAVEALTARQRCGMMDQTFKHKIDWGLGFIVNSNQYGLETVPYGFGRHCSQRTFGHSGMQSSTGFADPEHGLVVALVLNGMPGEQRHNQRIRDINSAIYEDLNLDS